MYPFRRILIPTDFSTASQWAVDDAARIAGTTGAEIVVVHVRMTWESDPSQLRFPADPAVFEYAEQQELETVRARLRSANAAITTRMLVRTGPDVGQAIWKTAVEENADLIVITTHARHHVAHLLIGSTTLAVISDPPAPVLAVRYGVRKRSGMHRIVVPVHLKQESHVALELAVAIAKRENSEVHLLTVCKDPERKAAEALLERLASGTQGVSITRQIVRGSDIEREIARYAEKVSADVIFLNATGQLSEAKIDIIRRSPTPVMIVPGEAKK